MKRPGFSGASCIDPRLIFQDVKHVEVFIKFAQDESSILSTSNWLDSPYIQP